MVEVLQKVLRAVGRMFAEIQPLQYLFGSLIEPLDRSQSSLCKSKGLH